MNTKRELPGKDCDESEPDLNGSETRTGIDPPDWAKTCLNLLWGILVLSGYTFVIVLAEAFSR